MTSIKKAVNVVLYGGIGKIQTEYSTHYTVSRSYSYNNDGNMNGYYTIVSKTKLLSKTYSYQSYTLRSNGKISISALLSTSFINYPGTTNMYYEYLLSNGYISEAVTTNRTNHSQSATTSTKYGPYVNYTAKYTVTYQTKTEERFYYSSNSFRLSYNKVGSFTYYTKLQTNLNTIYSW